METHLEQRRNRRYEAKLAVHAEFEGLPGVIKGLTRNISSRGVFFSIPRNEAIQISAKVALEILVPEDFVFASGTMKGIICRIRCVGRVLRLLNDASLDVTRVAVEFSSYRFVRDETESTDTVLPPQTNALLEHSLPEDSFPLPDTPRKA